MPELSRDQLRSAIHQILLNDWDPHNAIGNPHAHGAYDAYIEPLIELLSGRTTEDEIIDWLHTREAETMCFPSLGSRRLKPIAAKLISLMH